VCVLTERLGYVFMLPTPHKIFARQTGEVVARHHAQRHAMLSGHVMHNQQASPDAGVQQAVEGPSPRGCAIKPGRHGGSPCTGDCV